MHLKVQLQTNCEATVIEGSSSIQVHKVDRRIEHAKVLALNIELGAADANLVAQLLVKAIAK